MSAYDYLIFDADHTVIDFDEDEKRAFRAAFRAAGMEADESAVADCWQFSADNWVALGLTQVHLPELRARFHELYHTHVRDIVRYMDETYRLGAGRDAAGRAFFETLAEDAHLVEGAAETLSALGCRYKLCIATNGLREMQAGRLASLASCFERVFVSEEMGLVKPDARFFTAMLSELHTTADRCLMIGDSLATDIAGAASVGMDSVWFDRRRAPLPPPYAPVAVISDLRELLALL